MIDKVKKSVREMRFPREYDIRIYKNVYARCGVGGLSVIVEVIGPEKEKIGAIDLRAVSQILEFYEKEGYEVGHHSSGRYESIQNSASDISSSFFPNSAKIDSFN